ncbi:MAG: hypothetical protein KY453_10370, partial [Gemmatimonadetes bacterium]|nr:hypothetical protein [Gemmatimonadota bacterium]
HLMHHVLGGRQRWVRFSGVATEWDFVEAPSQLLEEWAWDTDVLRSFATDADGEPIPADLVRRMRAADEFGKGFLARTHRQMVLVESDPALLLEELRRYEPPSLPRWIEPGQT